MMDLTEYASLFDPNEILIDYIEKATLKSVTKANDGSLVFTFNDDTQKVFSRSFATAQGVIITSANVNAQGELRIQLSSGAVLNLGVITTPIAFNKATGTGYLTGRTATELTFKPLVAGDGVEILETESQFLIRAIGVPPSGRTLTAAISVAELYTGDTQGGTLGANSWFKRNFNTLRSNTLSNTTFAGGVLSLRSGEYNLAGHCLIQAPTTVHTRLFNITTQTPLVTYTALENGVLDLAGTFTLLQPAVVELQHYCTQTWRSLPAPTTDLNPYQNLIDYKSAELTFYNHLTT